MNETTLKKVEKDTHLFKLGLFINSFDKKFKELVLLQNEIFKILNESVKKINKLNNGG